MKRYLAGFAVAAALCAPQMVLASDTTPVDQSAVPTVTLIAAGQYADLPGDAEKGAKVFRKCRACHKADEEKNGQGPHLVGILGRPSGSVEGFKYSEAMAGAGIEWTPENLAAFLEKPSNYLKGTKMKFAGLRKPADIENLLAYFASLQN
jgi:cytochrome c